MVKDLEITFGNGESQAKDSTHRDNLGYVLSKICTLTKGRLSNQIEESCTPAIQKQHTHHARAALPGGRSAFAVSAKEIAGK